MKKFSIHTFKILITLIVFLFCSTIALAEENSEKNPRERMMERKTEVSAKNEERKMARDDLKEAAIKEHTRRLSNRFGFYSERLVNVLNKLRTRLELMAAEGKDVTDATAKLNEAQAALDNSKLLGDQAIAIFSEINAENYESQREKVQEAKVIVAKAREEFKKAVALMRESIKLAKAVSADAEEIE